MTQVRTPTGSAVDSGSGAERAGGDSETVVAITFPQTPMAQNVNVPVDYWEAPGFTTSASSELGTFVAKGDGRIVGVTAYARTVATDGTNGWRLKVLNEDQADAIMMDVGLGSDTNAAAANDNDTQAVNTSVFIPNSLTADANHFLRGDILTLDVIGEDGTAGDTDLVFMLSYEAQGHV